MLLNWFKKMRKVISIFGIILCFAVFNQIRQTHSISNEEQIPITNTIEIVSSCQDDDITNSQTDCCLFLYSNSSSRLNNTPHKTRTLSHSNTYRYRPLRFTTHKDKEPFYQSLLIAFYNTRLRSGTSPFYVSSPCIYYVFALRKILC